MEPGSGRQGGVSPEIEADNCTRHTGTHTALHELVSRRTESASDASCSVVWDSEVWLRLLHGWIVNHWLRIRHLRDWRGIIVVGSEVLGGVARVLSVVRLC